MLPTMLIYLLTTLLLLFGTANAALDVFRHPDGETTSVRWTEEPVTTVTARAGNDTLYDFCVKENGLTCLLSSKNIFLIGKGIVNVQEAPHYIVSQLSAAGSTGRADGHCANATGPVDSTVTWQVPSNGIRGASGEEFDNTRIVGHWSNSPSLVLTGRGSIFSVQYDADLYLSC